VIFKSVAGTGTVNGVCKAGNNAAKDNFMASGANALSVASINGIAAQNSLAQASVGTNSLLVDLSGAPVVFSITTPATGTGGFAAAVWWVIFGSLLKTS